MLVRLDNQYVASHLGRSWGVLATAGALLGAGFLYRDTLLTMARLWSYSQTYAHGWLIAPVSVWLAWRNIRASEPLPLEPAPWGLAAVAAAGLLWMAGHVAQAGVVEQLAVVATFGAIVTTVCGYRYARLLAFPLAFLLLAVPFGDPLIEPLMSLTAAGTVHLLQLSGIPVYRDGMLFSTGVGNFEVAQACSGIRYLIASLATGLLYSYLALRTLRYRAIFTAAAALVPLAANSVRAYLIVMLAHFSDMSLARGVDHFVYGWLFFALVTMGLLWLGERMRRRESRHLDTLPTHSAPAARSPPAEPSGRRIATGTVLAATCVVLAAVSVSVANTIDARLGIAPLAPRGFPMARWGWSGPLEPTIPWKMSLPGAASILTAEYVHPSLGRVAVGFAYYAKESAEGKLISSRNALAERNIWHLATLATRDLPALGSWSVTRFGSPAGGRTLTVWSTYELRGHSLSSPLVVKALTPLARIQSPRETAVLIAVATIGSREESEQALADFVSAHRDSLIECARPDAGQLTRVNPSALQSSLPTPWCTKNRP